MLAASPAECHNGEYALAYPMDSVKIDGELSDWPAFLPYYTLNAFQANPPEDAADFQGRFRIGYNAPDGAFYVSVEVEDDATVLDFPDSLVTTRRTPYHRDGAGFFLAPLHASGSMPFSVWEDSSQHRAFRSAHVEKRHIAFAVQRSDGRHIYEWRLDIAGVGATRIEPLNPP